MRAKALTSKVQMRRTVQTQMGGVFKMLGKAQGRECVWPFCLIVSIVYSSDKWEMFERLGLDGDA